MVYERFKFPHESLAVRFSEVCSKLPGVSYSQENVYVYTSAEGPTHAQMLIIASCMVAGWELAWKEIFKEVH